MALENILAPVLTVLFLFLILMFQPPKILHWLNVTFFWIFFFFSTRVFL